MMIEERNKGTSRSMRISVVVPHLNQPEMLDRCLNSIWSGSRLPDQVFVIDNRSTQLPEAVVAAYPGSVLLQEPTPGPGPARNRGAGAANGDILAFIDADCMADRDWLAAAEAALLDPTAEILGGDVRIAVVDPVRPTMLEAYECIYAYRMDRYIAEQGFTGTGNLVVRRAVLNAVGPFAGLAVAEDRDWGHRATASGHRIRYVAAMRVYHPARKDFAGIFAKWDRQLGHDYYAARQEGSRGRIKWLAKMLAMGVSPFAELPRIISSDRVSGFSAKARAFVGLVKIRFYRMYRMAWLMAGGDPDALSGRWNRPAADR